MLDRRPIQLLLCLADPADIASVAKYVKRPTYFGGPTCTWRSTDSGLISFAGLYPDGWNHSNGLGVISGIPQKISLRARVHWLPGPDATLPNRLTVSMGNQRSEIVLENGLAKDLELELPEKGFAYLSSSTTREASEIWSSTDPRVLGF